MSSASSGSVTARVRAQALLGRDDWDAIVIGSGVGSLVTGALLATRASMRVLVLERHYEPGGLTQTFRRRRFAWQVGVHYVGDVAPGALTRRLFDRVTEGRLGWSPLPKLHDRLVAPGFDARLGGDREALRAQWLAHAPGEERAIDRLLEEIETCVRAVPGHLLGRAQQGASETRAPFFTWADRTSQQMLDEVGASPRLAGLVTYPWGDYASPPERSSFAELAINTAHYFGGAFHPVGGGARIAHELAQTIATHRGAVVVRADVDEILIDGGRAVGVRLVDGLELRAPLVVSGVGARPTFDRLVRAPTETRAQLRELGPSLAHVGLYVGIARPAAALGLDGHNLWILGRRLGERDPAAADAWARGHREEPEEVFVSATCAIDPEAPPADTTLTAAVLVPYEPFAPFASSLRGERHEAYDARKQSLLRGMLAVLGRHVPLDAMEHAELSTPLSTAFFAGHAHGETSGLEATPARFRHGPRPHTSIAGLFLTGADVWTCGVAGAAWGGLLAASAITRRDLARELVFR